MKNRKLTIKIICVALIAISILAAIAVKSTVTFSELISGNWKVDIEIVKDISFNIFMGIAASAILTLFIEWSNELFIDRRNIGIKQIIMRKYSFLAHQTLQELISGTDRDLMSVIYDYHHLNYLVTDRLSGLKTYGENFLKDYIDVFTNEEIDLICKINRQCQLVQELTESPYSNNMRLYDKELSRYYSSVKYKDMPLSDNKDLDKSVYNHKDELDRIVSYNKKLVQPIIDLLRELEQKMPYLFSQYKPATNHKSK